MMASFLNANGYLWGTIFVPATPHTIPTGISNVTLQKHLVAFSSCLKDKQGKKILTEKDERRNVNHSLRLPKYTFSLFSLPSMYMKAYLYVLIPVIKITDFLISSFFYILLVLNLCTYDVIGSIGNKLQKKKKKKENNNCLSIILSG